ncbi:MAG: histidine kinase N-terminal 7TM domain-containing protein, partial [bacterium]
MAISRILTIVILITILNLGVFAYFKNSKRKVNRLFFITVLWIIIWMSSNFLENEVSNLKLSTLFLRVDFASAALLVYFWLLFCINFPNPIKLSKIKRFFLAIPGILFFFLSFSNLIIFNIRYTDIDIIEFSYGILYPIYAIYILFFFLGSSFNLLRKYKKASGIARSQILYVLLGFTISSLNAAIVNLFLQNYLPKELFRIGIYGIIFLVGFTTYAVVKHHLMNIKVIATEMFAFFISIVLLVDALLAKSIKEFILKFSIFFGGSLLGTLLIRGV